MVLEKVEIYYYQYYCAFKRSSVSNNTERLPGKEGAFFFDTLKEKCRYTSLCLQEIQIIFMFPTHVMFHFPIEVSLIILDSTDFILLWSSS